MWKIFAGLCVRRPAIVSPKLNEFESTIQKLYSDLELQHSHLSVHEKRIESDLARMSKSVEKIDDVATRKTENDSLLTAKDMELAWEADLRTFDEARSSSMCSFCTYVLFAFYQPAQVKTAFRLLSANKIEI